MTARVTRDERAIHDQIIGHDLVGLDERQLLCLLIIELRRAREQMAELSEHVRPARPDRG